MIGLFFHGGKAAHSSGESFLQSLAQQQVWRVSKYILLLGT
jgi:hypothetical protein